MSLSASAAVSMEGKGLWLIKSLPIQADTWLRSKLLVSMLPPALGGLVCGVALTVGWQLPVWNVFVIVGLSLLVAWAFSVVELAIGLHFARFDWENPAEVVKQGGGVMLSMLVTLVFLYLHYLMYSGLHTFDAAESRKNFVCIQTRHPVFPQNMLSSRKTSRPEQSFKLTEKRNISFDSELIGKNKPVARPVRMRYGHAHLRHARMPFYYFA